MSYQARNISVQTLLSPPFWSSYSRGSDILQKVHFLWHPNNSLHTAYTSNKMQPLCHWYITMDIQFAESIIQEKHDNSNRLNLVIAYCFRTPLSVWLYQLLVLIPSLVRSLVNLLPMLCCYVKCFHNRCASSNREAI